MPRFFLHIDDGTQRIEDEEGSELPDPAAARDEALAAARQLWGQAILKQEDIGACQFRIANSDGSIVDTVGLDEGLPLGLLEGLIMH